MLSIFLFYLISLTQKGKNKEKEKKKKEKHRNVYTIEAIQFLFIPEIENISFPAIASK